MAQGKVGSRGAKFFWYQRSRRFEKFLDACMLHEWYLSTGLNYLNMSKMNLSHIIKEN